MNGESKLLYRKCAQKQDTTKDVLNQFANRKQDMTTLADKSKDILMQKQKELEEQRALEEQQRLEEEKQLEEQQKLE